MPSSLRSERRRAPPIGDGAEGSLAGHQIQGWRDPLNPRPRAAMDGRSEPTITVRREGVQA